MEIETDRLEADHLVHIHHLQAERADRSSTAVVSVPGREKEEERPREVRETADRFILQTGQDLQIIQTAADRLEKR